MIYAQHQWPLSSEGLLNVPHLLWHGATLYNGHLRGPVMLSPAVTTCFYDLGLSRPGIESRSSACKAYALPLRHRGGVWVFFKDIVLLLPKKVYFNKLKSSYPWWQHDLWSWRLIGLHTSILWSRDEGDWR